MTLYEIAYLLTPPIIMKVLRKSICYIPKLHKKNPSTLDQIIKTKEKMLIIGNGPSLTKNLERDIEKFKDFDCIVVNHFCETKYYAQIKPKFYLLADPVYFGDIDTYNDWWKTKINNLIDSLLVNTQWDMNLIIPSIANNSDFLLRIHKNQFIHPYLYNNKNLIRYDESNKIEKFKFWNKNLIEPPAQTCLNTCVWLAIFLRYKEAYIIGADSNWLELIRVDQKTNELYINDIHFYGQKSQKVKLCKDSMATPSSIGEELASEAKAFNNYTELKYYADYTGVKIYNVSEYSLIDAFERKKFDS